MLDGIETWWPIAAMLVLLFALAAGLISLLWVTRPKADTKPPEKKYPSAVCIKCRRLVCEVNRSHWCYSCFSGSGEGQG